MGGLDGRQHRASLSVSSTTMNRNQPLDMPDLPRNTLSMKPPPFSPKSLVVAESSQPRARDPPSKLAGLPFGAYKRPESKTVPPSPSVRSILLSVSPVGKPVDKGKASIKRRRVASGTVQPSSFIHILILVKFLKPRAVLLVLSRKLLLLMQKLSKFLMMIHHPDRYPKPKPSLSLSQPDHLLLQV